MTNQHERVAPVIPAVLTEMSASLTGGPEPARAEPSGEPTHVASSGQIEAAGRVIVNPISGERIVIRQSGEQTDGQMLVFDLFLPPGGHVPARHVHPIQEEQFTVLAGLMRFRLGRRTILAHPGETVLIPAGKAHWFGNAAAEEAHARVEVRPALRTEELFETTEAMGQAGQLHGTRLPRLSDLARLLLDFQPEVAVPNIPAFLVKALLAPLAWHAQRRARDVTPGSAG